MDGDGIARQQYMDGDGIVCVGGLGMDRPDNNLVFVLLHECRIFGDWRTSLVVWCWLGDLKTVGHLSNVCRGTRFTTRIHCAVCGPSKCLDRRLVVPFWLHDFRDLVHYNHFCWNHALDQIWPVWMAQYAQYGDDAVRIGFYAGHRRRCLCSICAEGRANLHWF
jgi:hypothetical protein